MKNYFKDCLIAYSPNNEVSFIKSAAVDNDINEYANDILVELLGGNIIIYSYEDKPKNLTENGYGAYIADIEFVREECVGEGEYEEIIELKNIRSYQSNVKSEEKRENRRFLKRFPLFLLGAIILGMGMGYLEQIGIHRNRFITPQEFDKLKNELVSANEYGSNDIHFKDNTEKWIFMYRPTGGNLFIDYEIVINKDESILIPMFSKESKYIDSVLNNKK